MFIDFLSVSKLRLFFFFFFVNDPPPPKFSPLPLPAPFPTSYRSPRREARRRLRPRLLPQTGPALAAPRPAALGRRPGRARPLVPGEGVGQIHGPPAVAQAGRSEEHTSELQSRQYLVCRLLLE